MKKHKSTLLMTEFVTHDVKRFIISKPNEFSFQPGQGVELAINHPNWRDKARPFTPTSLPTDHVLEFTIKGYSEHNGVTRQLHGLTPGSELLVSDPFGSITYQGPGTFIAGGAGITPFLSILRNIARRGELTGHSLLLSNKTPADIICEKELRYYLGERCILSCTHEAGSGYENRHFDKEFLSDVIHDFTQHFYVCGPSGFTKNVRSALTELGAHPEALIFER